MRADRDFADFPHPTSTVLECEPEVRLGHLLPGGEGAGDLIRHVLFEEVMLWIVVGLLRRRWGLCWLGE